MLYANFERTNPTVSDGHDHEDDDNEEVPVVPIRFLMPQLPVPTREQVEQHHMAVQANQHDAYRLFSELDAEQLKSLNTMLHVITCNSPSPNPIAEYFEGIAVGVLLGRHNLCIACGVDHDKELHNMGEEMPDGEGS